MGKAVDIIIAVFLFIIFLFTMDRMGITFADVIAYFQRFFGISILAAAANSRVRRKAGDRIEDLLRSRVVRGIMGMIPRRRR